MTASIPWDEIEETGADMTEFEALVTLKKQEHVATVGSVAGCTDVNLIDVVEKKEYGEHVKLVCRECGGETFVWRGPEKPPSAAKRRNPHHRY
jgi:hypothetical protein